MFKCFFVFLMASGDVAGIEFFREVDLIPQHPNVLLAHKSDERVWVMRNMPLSSGHSYGCYEFDKPENSYVIIENMNFETVGAWLDEVTYFIN